MKMLRFSLGVTRMEVGGEEEQGGPEGENMDELEVKPD